MVEEGKLNEPDSATSNLSHEELVHMLVGLQADVEARDVIIASLECEQNYLLFDDAKRHRYFMSKAFEIDPDDPILALQRDSRFTRQSVEPTDRHNTLNSGKSRFAKIVSLEELIDAQRRIHSFYREQLQSAEQRYSALCSSFEEERKRLERDAAQGDDVVAMLEKEREKLQVELENEKSQNKRLEKDLKKALDGYNNQKSLSQRQRIVAAQLIKEKRRLQKELLAKCEQVEQLESKLRLNSTPPPEPPSSANLLNVAVTVKAANNPAPRSPIGGGRESLRCKKSLSPPSACRESANAPPPPPSPLVPSCSPSASCGISTSNRMNGCSSPSSPVSFSDGSSSEATKSKSPPPVKTRPDPPVRRTPEFNNPTAISTHKSGPLEVDTTRIGVTTASALETEEAIMEEDEKHAASPSPPPPPPQMQLHYPYPGMQGNTHHPPVRIPRSTFGGSHFGTTSTSHLAGTRESLRSPTSPPIIPVSHQLRCVQPQRVTNILRITGNGGSALRKTTPTLPQHTRGGIVSTPRGVLSRPAVTPAPRMVLAGRATAGQSATATAGPGNLYINGK